MPDVLDVVVVLHDVQQLLHLGDLLLGLQLLIVLGNHLDLGGDEGVALGGQGIGHGVEVVGVGVDGEHIVLGLKVVGSAVHGIHHHGILFQLPFGVVDDQHALLVKGPADAAGGTQVAAELVEVMTHGTGGPVPVVGHGLHNDGHAAGAVAFVGDGLIVVPTGTGSLLQATLDVVVGHVGGLGLGDDGSQPGVVGGIGAAALLHRNDQLLGDLGEGSRALGILCALGFLNVMPFGMSGHCISTLSG